VAGRLAFAIPGDLDSPTGGYGYDRRIIAELRTLGWDVEIVALGDPRRLLAVAADRTIVVDGLAFGRMPDVAALRPMVALVHHPLAYETGLSAEEAERLRDSERAALASARKIIATSEVTSDLLVADYGVPRARVEVVLPGTDRVPLSKGSGGVPLQLLSVGAISTRKGFDLLVDALARVAELDWYLTIAGDRSRDAGAAARLDAAVERHGLAGRIDRPGAVSAMQLEALYQRADLFVLASQFEGYGMAYAEALAHGLPVIGTTGGAIPGTVPATAGRLVQPGDVDALAGALRDVISNAALRKVLAQGARAAALSLPTWAESGARFARALG